MRNTRALAAVAALATVILACIGAKEAAPGATSQDDDLRAARTRGSANAPVTIYEMSDFQCPWCGKFVRETMPTLEREYVATGKVKLVFVNFPLSMHRNAEPAAELAMCAAKQGRFWQMHDQLFRTQDRWETLDQPGTFFLALADSAGADRDQITGCMRAAATRALVQSDADGAVRSGARSTPTFYIEGGLMAGAQPIEVFRQVLDSIIRTKTAR